MVRPVFNKLSYRWQQVQTIVQDIPFVVWEGAGIVLAPKDRTLLLESPLRPPPGIPPGCRGIDDLHSWILWRYWLRHLHLPSDWEGTMVNRPRIRMPREALRR